MELTLGQLAAVVPDVGIYRPRLSRELEVALGSGIAYFKRCVHKGLIKIKHWTSPDLVESVCLLLFVRAERRLEGGRAHVAQARIPPARVIEAFDVLANGVACLPA